MKITRIEEKHIPEILEIWKAFMDFHRDLDPVFQRKADAADMFAKFLREQYLAESSKLALAAVEDDAVAGFLIGQIKEHPPVLENVNKYGHLDTAAVAPDLRRQGVGGLLFEAAKNWFRARGITRLELEAAPDNPLGYPFWSKNGFRTYIHTMALELEP